MVAGFIKKRVMFGVVLIASVIAIIITIYWITNSSRVRITVGLLQMSSNVHETRLIRVIRESIDNFNKYQSKYSIVIQHVNANDDLQVYKQGAEQMCAGDEPVVCIFGGLDRQAILSTLEKYNNLLCYPKQYEGSECSRNVMYFGAPPNQQIDIGIEYGIKNISRNVLLIGSNDEYSRVANQIMSVYIEKYGATKLDEIYVAGDDAIDFTTITMRIVEQYGSTGCLIMNTLNGQLSAQFFKSLYDNYELATVDSNGNVDSNTNEHAVVSNVFPIMSFSVSEPEIQSLELKYVHGNYFIWNYSQLDRSFQNFVEKEFNNNNQTLNEMITSYTNANIIYGDPDYHGFLSALFFAEFLVSYTGTTFDAATLREAYLNRKNVPVLTPTGYLTIQNNNHLDNPVYILKVGLDKRFHTVYRTPIAIRPNPWFDIRGVEEYECDVTNYMGEKYIRDSIISKPTVPDKYTQPKTYIDENGIEYEYVYV